VSRTVAQRPCEKSAAAADIDYLQRLAPADELNEVACLILDETVVVKRFDLFG
jgi:hypothetical protein